MLRKSLIAGKHQLLRGEYILQQYDFMTAQALRERYFNKTEVEYILWGHELAWDNVRETAMNIFLLRTLLHSAYEFIRSPIPEVAVRLGQALLLGLKTGLLEVETLFDGDEVPAFPGQTQLKMSYRDHLRLFLIIQLPQIQLKHMSDLISANLGYWRWQDGPIEKAGAADPGALNWQPIDLANFFCAVEAKAEVEIELWPLGKMRLSRQGVMGYDRPFTLVE
jgi:hypothetical protein